MNSVKILLLLLLLIGGFILAVHDNATAVTGVASSEIVTNLILILLILGWIFVFVMSAKHAATKEELGRIKAELQRKHEEFLESEAELQKNQQDLRIKNAELELLLEDFYTMRLRVVDEIEVNVFVAENKQIREKLDEIKSWGI